jgi:SH3-like domain-containing protein
MKSLSQIIALCLALTAILAITPTFAQVNEQDNDISTSATGLPIPRFVSLKTNEVNMRTGPGTRYPIDWVLTRKGLPVEIIAEYDIWRRIRDPEGDEGWVHKSALSGRRSAIVTEQIGNLHESEEATSPIFAKLEIGAQGLVVSCNVASCRLKFDDADGYLLKTNLWGVYLTEIIK